MDSINPRLQQTFIFQNKSFLKKLFCTEQRFIKQHHDFESKVTDQRSSSSLSSSKIRKTLSGKICWLTLFWLPVSFSICSPVTFSSFSQSLHMSWFPCLLVLDNSCLQFQTHVFIFSQSSSFLHSCLHFYTIVFFFFRLSSSFLDRHLHFQSAVFIFRQTSSFLDNSRLHFQTTVIFIFRQTSSFLNSRLHFQTDVFIFRQQSSSFLDRDLHFCTVVFIFAQLSSFLDRRLHFQTTVVFIFRQQSSSFLDRHLHF